MSRNRHGIQAVALLAVLLGVLAGGNCERWCPFGGVEAIYTYAAEGNMLCSLGTSNFFILGGVLLATLLVRRAFCGYLCPLGAISEAMHAVGRRLRLPALRVSPRVDRVLSLAKYGLLVAVLVLTWRAGELIFRGFDPCYALVSRHGEDITYWAYVVSAAILVASLFFSVPFCRWLCPLAAVLNPLSRFGWARVHRDATTCRDCGRCAKACPMAIPVDQLDQVRTARCIACLECVGVCRPRKGEPPALRLGPPRPSLARWPQAAVIGLLLACTTVAVGSSYLFPLPSFVSQRGAPPEKAAQTELTLDNLTCRGRGALLMYFLDRDDLFAIPGYLRVEAWPGPGAARVRLGYDPALTDEAAIKQAITEPYYEVPTDYWRNSPFRIDGYDPLGLDDEAAGY